MRGVFDDEMNPSGQIDEQQVANETNFSFLTVCDKRRQLHFLLAGGSFCPHHEMYNHY